MKTSATGPFRLPWLPGASLFTGPPTPALVQETFPLGIAAKLLTDTDRNRLSIGALTGWLSAPIRLGQILFLTSWERTPLGFATWACLDDKTLDQMASGNQDFLQLEEWNEGSNLWIVDLVAPYGHARELIRHLRAVLAPKHDVAHYRRRNRYGTVVLATTSMPTFSAWGPAAEANLMFDLTGHVLSSPFDRGWILGQDALDPPL